MDCARCDTPLKHIGDRQFHEGPRWGALGEIGELFTNKESFSLYVCRTCGEISFFAPDYSKEDTISELELEIAARVHEPEKSPEEVVQEDSQFQKWLDGHPEVRGRDLVDQIALYRDFQSQQ